MSPLSFMHPIVLTALLVVPVIAVVAILARRSRSLGWKKLVAPRLRHKLSTTTSSWRFWTSLVTALVGLTLLIISLSRPFRGMTEENAVSKGRNILLIMDTSRSMRVADLPPSRLDVARTIAFECLSTLTNDRVGILAFANQPFILAPLTIDHDIIGETIEQLDHDTIPEGGSDIATAVNMAVKTLKDTGQAGNAIIVMSDGENHESRIEAAAAMAKEAGIPVLTIGLGTIEGEVIPDSSEPDGIFRGPGGRPVISRLQDAGMRTLARDTDGLYIPAENMTNAAQLVTSTLAGLDRVALDSRLQRKPNDVFQWFLLPGLSFLMFSLAIRTRFRGNIPPALTRAAAVSIFFLAMPDAQADLSSARNALEKGDFSSANDQLDQTLGAIEESPSIFRRAVTFLNGGPSQQDTPAIHYARGATHYRNGDFESAASDFSKALLDEDASIQTEAEVSLANALARQGEAAAAPPQESADGTPATQPDIESAIGLIEDSISHYETALKRDAQHGAAQTNLDLVKKRLELLKQQKQKQEQEQQEQDKKDQEQKEEEEKKEDEGKKEEEENQKPSESGDEGEQKDDGPGDEKDNANEENGEPSDEEKAAEDEAKKQAEKDQQAEQDGTNEGDTEGDQEPLPGQAGNENGEPTEEERQAAREAARAAMPQPRAEESDEEFALRILEENADLDKPPGKKSTAPKRGKNW